METKKYQLPRVFAEKWVKALRSGEYRQGIGHLKTADDRFCCLGIACVISNASDRQIDRYAYIPIKSKINVPIELKGSASEKGIVNEVTRMNDNNLSSFPEIADWIEANVEFV